MKKLVVALALGLAVALAPAPSFATIDVTIQPSATVIDVGQSVTLKGRAEGAAIGRTVRLQRKQSGVWKTVASSTLSSRRTYSFDTTPPKGKQVYRAFLPRQSGQPQAASPIITVAVRWTPKLTLDPVVAAHDLAGEQFLDVTGRSNAIGATVRLERQNGSLWFSWGEAVVTSTGSYAARLPNLPEGTVVRARVPGSGPRLVSYSGIQVTDLLPFTLTLDGPAVTLRGIAGSEWPLEAPGAIARFEAETGDLVTFDWPDFGFHSEYVVLGPDGAELAPTTAPKLIQSTPTPYFVIPVDGTYSIRIAQEQDEGATTLRGYTAHEFPTTIDTAPMVLGEGTTLSRMVTLPFEGRAGQEVGAAIEYDGFCGGVELLRDGQIVPREMTQSSRLPMWNLPADALYDLAFIPCPDSRVQLSRVRIADATQRTAVLDGAPATALIDGPGEGAVFSVDLTAGDVVTLATATSTGLYSWAKVEGPDGAIVELTGGELEFTVPASGTYRVVHAPVWFASSFPGELTFWASTPLEVEAQLNGPPTPLDAAAGRRMDFHFSGSAGQYVTLRAELAQQRCEPTLHLFDENGPLDTYIGTLDAVRLPHDGSYELRVYPCAGSGSIGLVSSEAVTLVPGESTRLELTRAGGALIAEVPVAIPDAIVEVTVSGIDFGGAAYRSWLFTPSGATMDRYPFVATSTTSTEPFTLFEWPVNASRIFYLRLTDAQATGAVDVTASVSAP